MKKIICILAVVLSITAFSSVGYAEALTPDVKSSILIESSTGKVMYEQNADEHLPIASVTKIMTMLLAMEKIDNGEMSFDDIITASERASSFGGSTMFLAANEQMTVSDIMKGIAVASANDGCVAMAEHIAGNEESFVEMMNRRAAELGMENTHFTCCNGLEEEQQYCSARDVAIMSRELIKHEKIFDYTKIWTDSLRDGKFALANTNKLVRYYDGATGLKTGSTDKAGCCLSATAERNGMSLIAVVLGAPNSKTRFASASGLLNYGYSKYAIEKYIEKDEIAGKIKVRLGKQQEIDVVAERSYQALVNKGKSANIEKEIKINNSIMAPVKKGDVVGEAVFTRDGKEITSVKLLAKDNVEKKKFIDILSDLLKSFTRG